MSRDQPADQPPEGDPPDPSEDRDTQDPTASTGPGGGPVGDGPDDHDDIRRVSYDCSPWAGETRRLLAGVLTNLAVPHAWEGTVLVVRREDEARVDELVEEVVATAVQALDPELPVVAYEISVLPAATQNDVVQALAAEGIPHEWDADGDIVIHEQDAPRLEELLDELAVETDPGDPTGGERDLDGLELHERLTDVFVAADRLVHDPADRRAGLDLLDADEALDGVGVPFGFDRSAWQEILDATADLVTALREAAERGGPLHEMSDELDAELDAEDDAETEDRADEDGADERLGGGGAGTRERSALGGVPVLGGTDEPDAPRSPDGADPSVQAQARRLRDLLRPML